MAHLELHLLGGFRLTTGSEVVRLPTRKAEALLAYLALPPGRAHRREALTALLCGDRGEPQARHSLSQTLFAIRRALAEVGPGPLVADRETIALNSAAVEVDAARFERLVAAGTPEALAEAAALYRSELLAGLSLSEEAFEEWLSGERGRLCELALSALAKLLNHRSGSGETEAAIQAAVQLLAIDPLQESAHRALMRLYAELGRRASALKQYEACAHALRQELGVEPEPETRALFEEISRSRTALRTRAASGTARPTPAPFGAMAPSPERQSDGQQKIRFATASDGVRIAYAAVGQGPPLVKAANWLNHLDFDWQSPVWRHWIEEFARDHCLIRYDERGNGLSDGEVEDLSFETFVRDLETVVDAAGLERFALLGISQGCAVSAAYAVRHPERVTHLVLYGGYAKGWRKRGSPEEIERREALLTLVRQGWGQDNPAFRQVFTSLFIPEASLEQMRWFNDLQRISASPENAVRILRVFGEIDVRPLLPGVRVPTLVLHSRGEATVPFEEGRELAALIPGADFVPLESRNHLLLEEEPAWPRFVAEVRGFLATERVPDRAPMHAGGQSVEAIRLPRPAHGDHAGRFGGSAVHGSSGSAQAVPQPRRISGGRPSIRPAAGRRTPGRGGRR